MHKTTFFIKKVFFTLILFLFLTSFSQSGKDGALTVSASNTVLYCYSRVLLSVLLVDTLMSFVEFN
jgi:hypothetical protein